VTGANQSVVQARNNDDADICYSYTALVTPHQDAVSGRRPPLNWSSFCRGL